MVFILCACGSSESADEALSSSDGTASAQAEAETEAETESEPVSPYVVSEASIGVTGDILIHDKVLDAAVLSDGSYDFSSMFEEIAPYWSDVDYMIANLEVTIADGSYSGYPEFRTPASIVTALKDAGVDCLLTANNHTYDGSDTGMQLTIETIESEGLDYTGTRSSEDASYVLIRDINDITFGMVCYTFDTRSSASEQKSLNQHVMSDETENLVNSFCYADLESLYESVREDLSEMEAAGCDVTIVLIHWGTEYEDAANDTQKEIAQALSDLGVDIIVGGHPHVIQEFEALTGDSGNDTLVLYSTGNTLSNQRREEISSEPDGYTEDGLTIEFTYVKYDDGSVSLSEVYILPTWVELLDGEYTIVPLDGTLSADEIAADDTSEALSSYERTIDRLGSGYPMIRSLLGNGEIPESLE